MSNAEADGRENQDQPVPEGQRLSAGGKVGGHEKSRGGDSDAIPERIRDKPNPTEGSQDERSLSGYRTRVGMAIVPHGHSGATISSNSTAGCSSQWIKAKRP